ncbi:MAG: hypothetical protein KGY75_01560 [Candidatus Cloacimonetes bacterium]|nr:hypothetical protein [Candidatus Cloacimonadota bacterium]MBS3766797.1 hypothetical protein [Candidatus Cloacimonadota bacterium]
MIAKATRNKISPKSHKKAVAFIRAEKLKAEDVESLKNYLDNRKDLHYIYLIYTHSLSKKIVTYCNKCKHIKLIHSRNPETYINDIKSQYDRAEVEFEERDFEELKARSF